MAGNSEGWSSFTVSPASSAVAEGCTVQLSRGATGGFPEATAPGSAPSTGPLLEFHDGFESNKGWGMFEELVAPDRACCREGQGEVVRSTDIARSGAYSLLVRANKTGSDQSDRDAPGGVVLSDPSSPTPSAVFPIGVTMATLTAADGLGGIGVDDVLITVQEATPPQVRCTTDVAAPGRRTRAWSPWRCSCRPSMPARLRETCRT
jgi:hypothetical protein